MPLRGGGPLVPVNVTTRRGAAICALLRRQCCFSRCIFRQRPAGTGPSGFWLTAILGIAGSIAATFIGQALGLYSEGHPAGFIASIIGGGDSASQFNRIAQSAPTDVLAKGLAAAFGSDQTPAIGNMAGQLFAQSNGAQQVQDVVNQANDVHPDVANVLGQFYAQHKGLINTLGGIAARWR